MRVIKFRAWNKQGRAWLYWTIPNDEESDINELARNLFFSCSDPKTRGEFIGLLDKNGKEVFEGDVVRATANGNRKYQLIWVEHGLGHWWITDIARDNLQPNRIPINLNAIEVIGNIYENPELLEAKK